MKLDKFQHLYPYKSHYMTNNGFQYHYLDEGQGEPIVMVHGNPTWSFYYRSLVNGLSDRFRTIVPDHIGCGLSEKPGADRYGYRYQERVDDLIRFLDHLEITQKITLVLHDWGGAIGTAYAVRYPERIARMVILNTAAFLPPSGKKIPWQLWLIRNIRPFAAPAVLYGNLFARAAIYMAARKTLKKDVRAGLLAPYNSPANRIATLKFVQDIPLVETDRSYHLLREVQSGLARLAQIPKLLCWGERDFVFDKSYFEEWKRLFPEAETKLFSGAGHYILEDDPQGVLESISEFLDKNPL